MLLRHATLARNLNSILRRGLLTAKSRGKLAAVWACGRAQTWWAALHVVLRHGGRIESTVVLEVDRPGPGCGGPGARPGGCGTASGTSRRPASRGC
jgi:hypothetical protein